jgi:hypothetical protein
MSRLLCVLALSPLLWLAAQPCFSADDKVGTSTYFPLEVGTTWTYRVGEARFKVKVTKHEKIGDVMAAKLETYGDKDKLISNEHVAVVEDKKSSVAPYQVVRVATNGERLTPPVPFLRLPPKKDAPWTFASKVGGKDVKGTFEVTATDQTVQVPAGSYRTVVVQGKNLEVVGNKLDLTYQFAENVGLVKQEMKLAGQTIVVELEKYEKPK